ncbi:TPA: hypothetical protein PXN94_004151 [Yersinia enterocolitica]|nr:hypothetical protein [Yersinia enterocolitica]
MNKLQNTRMLTTTILLMFGKMAIAAGIPIINIADPIKISESRSYSCNNGKAMQLLDSGRKQFIVYDNKSITCHDDNLWLDGKAISFVDLVNFAAAEASKKLGKAAG